MAKIKRINIDENPIPDTDPVPEKAQRHRDNSPEAKRKRKKIAIISAFCVMCLIGVVSYIVVYCLPEYTPANKNPMHKDALGQYGSTQSYIFYPIDDEIDITKVKEYQELDRLIHYTFGPETIAVTEETLGSYGEEIKFFYNYFELVKAGDYTAYNKLFTDKYYKENPYYVDFTFTQQMVYDINIEKLGQTEQDGKTVYNFDVTYKIFRNNGTFRNDIIDNMSKTLYFTLVEGNDGILIDSIQYYVK
ncbi:MAG: hypothetical protein E7575_03510 [Ruminococcaceae bacterium]|nr:hypothetical protein [Oscillospiraceae bacterium]